MLIRHKVGDVQVEYDSAQAEDMFFLSVRDNTGRISFKQMQELGIAINMAMSEMQRLEQEKKGIKPDMTLNPPPPNMGGPRRH